jgi:hypothetical protein
MTGFTSDAGSGITRLESAAVGRKFRPEPGIIRREGRNALRIPLPSDLAKTNFTKAADLWLEGRNRLVAPKTYQTDKDRLKPLKANFGNLQLRDITIDLVKGYQLRRLDRVGPRTINLETKVLRMILKSARLWGRIADEYKPLAENRRGPGRALTPEQEETLFKTASSNTRWELLSTQD